jgi:hypothetical protein
VLVVGPRNKQVMVCPLVETREQESRGKQGFPTKVEVKGCLRVMVEGFGAVNNGR